MTQFWDRMAEHFGARYAEAVAADQVITELGGLTINQALEAGVDTKKVWRAVCATFDVPASLR